MSSQLTRILSAVFFVLTVLIILIHYTSFASLVISPYTSPQKQNSSVWKGWANVDTIVSFIAGHTEFEIPSSGDSYTATNFHLNEQQPCPEDPFGNPPYDHHSPYLKWIEYLTMTYNDSKIETYNFAVQGATVDQGLIDRGSAFSRQVGEKFLPNYEAYGTPRVGGNDEGRSQRRTNRNGGREGGPMAIWEPQTTLFSIWFGINDSVFSNRSEVLFDRVFESYERTVNQLYTAGAQNFLFLNVPPIERGPHHDSSTSLAKSISSWNVRLAHLASKFSSTHPVTAVFLFDVYALFNRILVAPEHFEQTRHFGNLEDQCDRYVKELTSQETYERECGVPYDQYFWRDGLHVTFPVHQVVAERVAGLLRGV